jgi:hypothetical protein
LTFDRYKEGYYSSSQKACLRFFSTQLRHPSPTRF